MPGGEPLQAAIVGAGLIGGIHHRRGDADNGPVYSHAQGMASAGIRLEAICDTNAERRDRFAANWNVPRRYGSLEDLLEHRYDIVTICTPDPLHAAMAQTVLNSPRSPRLLILEKPICTQSNELDEIAASLAKATDTSLVVNLSKEYDAAHEYVKSLVASRELGEVVQARAITYGGWLRNGSHLSHILRMFFGDTVTCIKAQTGFVDQPGDPGLEGIFRTDEHPQATIQIENFSERWYQLYEWEIRLTEGRIRLYNFGSEVEIDRVDVNESGERELTFSYKAKLDDADPPIMNLYRLAREHLVNGDRGIVERSGFAVAKKSMELLFSAREMIRE